MRALGMTTAVIEEGFRNQEYVGKHRIEKTAIGLVDRQCDLRRVNFGGIVVSVHFE